MDDNPIVDPTALWLMAPLASFDRKDLFVLLRHYRPAMEISDFSDVKATSDFFTFFDETKRLARHFVHPDTGKSVQYYLDQLDGGNDSAYERAMQII